MGEREKKTSSMFSALFLILTFLLTFSAAEQLQSQTKDQNPTPDRSGSSFLFPVQGDVSPHGYFYAIIYLGNPPKRYFLDIDTGSDLTWVQCAAGPEAKLLKAPNNPYKPNKNALLLCKDPLCKFVDQPMNSPCNAQNNQCDYEVRYADYGSSLGVVVRDSFTLKFTNGTMYNPMLAFGCGYDQEFSGPFPAPYVDGVLGLGNGKSSIVSQLLGVGPTQNIIGHCFGGQGKGFLFIGDHLLPSALVWAPKLPNALNHYMAGPVDLLLGGTLGPKGLNVIFDSGSTYTYLNPQAYQATLALIKTALLKKPLSPVKDGNLPICWKGVKPFHSIDAVKNYFSLLALRFTNTKNTAFLLPPESYLIISSHGNVCLGILNGADANLGSLNIIGDISMQDKLVVYDNVRERIGWTSYNCHKLPKSL